MELQLTDIKSIKAFSEAYPDIKTEAAIRWDVWNSAHNGLDDYGAVIRKGRRVYIVAPRYLDWLLAGATK